jgi:hypothetical protein
MSAATPKELEAAALEAHQIACALLCLHATGAPAENVDDAYGLVELAARRLSERLYALAGLREGAQP